MTALQFALKVVRHCRARSAIFVLVGLATCLGLSAMLIAGNVKGHEYERRVSLVEAGASVWGHATYQLHDGDTVTVIALRYRDGRTDQPPGVATTLRPGEIVMSPALADLVSREEDVASWFPYEDTGRIEREGLTWAGELKAYLVEHEPTRLTDLTADLGSGELSSFAQYQRVGFLLFCAAPALGLIIVGSRVGRSRRAERRQALRLLGMSRRSARWCLALELAIPALLGAGAAQVVLLLVATRDRIMIPVVDRWVFGADIRLGVLQVAVVVMAVGVASAVAGATVGASDVHPRSSVVDRLRREWMAPIAGIYAIGLSLAAWSWALAQPKDLRRVIAIVAVTVGLPAAVATTAALLARLLLRRNVRLVTFLAAKRVNSDPRVATRFASMAGVIVFVLSVAQPLSTSLALGDDPWMAYAQDADSIVVAVETFSPNARFVPDGRPPASVRHLVPIVELAPVGSERPRRASVRAVIATCADLDELVVLTSACSSRPALLVSNLDGRSGARPGRMYRLASADRATSVELEMPSDVLRHRERQYPLNADLVVPPSHPLALAAQRYGASVGAMFTSPANDAAWAEAHAWVVRTSPLFAVDEQFDRAIVDGTPRWFMIGTIFAVAFAALGGMLTVIDDRTRRRGPGTLRVLGVTAREATQIQVIEAVVAALSIAVVAGAAAIVVASAFVAVDEQRLEAWRAIATITLAGAASVIAVAAISSTLAERSRHRKPGRRRLAPGANGRTDPGRRPS